MVNKLVITFQLYCSSGNELPHKWRNYIFAPHLILVFFLPSVVLSPVSTSFPSGHAHHIRVLRCAPPSCGRSGVPDRPLRTRLAVNDRVMVLRGAHARPGSRLCGQSKAAPQPPPAWERRTAR